MKPFAERAMNGEENIFTQEKVAILAVTSGTTTGKRNFIPLPKSTAFSYIMRLSGLVFRRIPDEFFPGNAFLRKSIKVFFKGSLQKTSTGIPIGSASTIADTKLLRKVCTAPDAAYDITSKPAFTYANWLFSLVDRSVGVVMCPYAAALYYELEFLMAHWTEMITDIESGHMSSKHVPDEEIRRRLDQQLKGGDKMRASELRAEFQKGKAGLVKRLWPYSTCVYTIDSGTLEPYGDCLRSSYCAGLPIHSGFYACTEGLIGLNLWPTVKPRRYLPVLDKVYFEFITYARISESNPPTLGLSEVGWMLNKWLFIVNYFCYMVKNEDFIASWAEFDQDTEY